MAYPPDTTELRRLDALSRARMAEVTGNAVPAYELAELQLFSAREEKHIQRDVDRLLYEPKLPWAGHRERSFVARLNKLARRTDWGGHGRARMAAKRWEDVDGWYYTRRPISPRENKEDWEWYTTARDAADRSEEWDLKWFAQMMLDGLPTGVADFKLECHFLLERADGNTDRMVRLRNIKGEATPLIAMDSEAFHAPQKFRKWCLNNGNYHWGAGEKELQSLHVDTGRANAFRKVKQIVAFGWYPLHVKRDTEQIKIDGIWFFRDAVYASDGTLLRPDSDGVYWHDDIGYMLSETGRENKFHQRAPHMYPGTSIASVNLVLSDEALAAVNVSRSVCKPVSEKENTVSGSVGKPVSGTQANPDLTHRPTGLPTHGSAFTGSPTHELSLLRAFWREFCDRMRRTVGSLDAYLMIGSSLSYMAAPEIFEEKNEFTGLWVHGSKESGKSTVGGWLMELDGLHLGRQGINLRGTNSTPTGMAQALDQYSNIPVWVDEFRSAEVGGDKISVLHQTYNRGGQTKFNPSMIQRETRTNFMVSGESTTGDAALLGRYMHIQMSADRREKDANGVLVPHEAWFEAHRRYFFFFKRFLLERRVEYAALVMKLLATWNDTQGISQRTKAAFGAPYAAFLAMTHMLESHGGDEMAELKRHTVVAAANAAADVSAETNINVFLVDMITAFKAGELDIAYFRVRRSFPDHAPGSPNQKGWTSYELYMDPDPVLSDLQRFLALRRSSVVLNRKDLRDQLSREAYWIHGKPTMRFVFGGAERPAKAWGIRIDDLPVLGYVRISDEARDAFILNPNEDSAVDPRKGDIFAIIEAVARKEDELKRGQ